jgi:hypothetical protein
MPNKILSGDEILNEIIRPFMRAVQEDLQRNPMKSGELRPYANPFGPDMLPLVISAPSPSADS